MPYSIQEQQKVHWCRAKPCKYLLKLEQLEKDFIAHESRFWPLKSVSRTYRELTDVHAENERERTCEEIFFFQLHINAAKNIRRRKLPFLLCVQYTTFVHILWMTEEWENNCSGRIAGYQYTKGPQRDKIWNTGAP